MATNWKWPEAGRWPALFVKPMVCSGCSFLEAQKKRGSAHCYRRSFHTNVQVWARRSRSRGVEAVLIGCDRRHRKKKTQEPIRFNLGSALKSTESTPLLRFSVECFSRSFYAGRLQSKQTYQLVFQVYWLLWRLSAPWGLRQSQVRPTCLCHMSFKVCLPQGRGK